MFVFANQTSRVVCSMRDSPSAGLTGEGGASGVPRIHQPPPHGRLGTIRRGGSVQLALTPSHPPTPQPLPNPRPLCHVESAKEMRAEGKERWGTLGGVRIVATLCQRMEGAGGGWFGTQPAPPPLQRRGSPRGLQRPPPIPQLCRQLELLVRHRLL